MQSSPNSAPHLAALLLVASMLLGACADYQFRVNDKVLYTPDILFTAYDIVDQNLRECVRQHVSDGSVSAAVQLTDLNCSHAGISDLQGIQIFSGLTHIKLSSNAISDISPLSGLLVLGELYLDGNEIASLSPIRALPKLSYLNVAGNTLINCTELTNMAESPGLKLVMPEHCRNIK
jgi:Leucine-rich repeat (LRR) protein